MTEQEKQEVAKHEEDEKDYEVFDESPFWFNGGGVINKKRTALFLIRLSNMEITRITEPLFNVDSFAVRGEEVFFCGEAYNAKPEMKIFNLYALDTRTGKVRTVCENQPLWGGTLTVVGDRAAAFLHRRQTTRSEPEQLAVYDRSRNRENRRSARRGIQHVRQRGQ